MKKEYALGALLIIFLYLLYLVGSYTYDDYRVGVYMEDIQNTNTKLLADIRETERELEQKTSLAHKNKVLKTEQGLKNKGEEVLFLITEERYKMFTEQSSSEALKVAGSISDRIGDTQGLIESMSIYERWMYFLFGKDIR